MTLAAELEALSQPLLERVRARGFDPERLLAWASTVGVDRDRRNRLQGRVEPPRPDDIATAPAPGSADYERFAATGREAIARGEIALCVLAGGMATRMGGVVKALVEALPGKTFLDLRLAENDKLRRESNGRPTPLWLMTSEATDGKIREALGSRLDGEACATFEQFVSLRLTPEGRLFMDERNEPSVYATGHGDLPDALRKSGLLQRFIDRGGRYVWIANLDNLGATVDPAILGWHMAHGGELTVEVVDKVGSDKGGGPVRWNDHLILAEEMRYPPGFDAATVPVFSTNTFLAGASALQNLSMNWTFVEVEKKIDDKRAIQFERIVNEMTVALRPHLLRVPREGAASRFLPVKDVPELERRRPEIEAIAKARGLLGGAAG
jgi:UTP--glucose-1-phosphate uridylyltransferase